MPARIHRKERTARLRTRTTAVTLDMVEAQGRGSLALPINVVDVREVGTAPRGEKPVHWRADFSAPFNTPNGSAFRRRIVPG